MVEEFPGLDAVPLGELQRMLLGVSDGLWSCRVDEQGRWQYYFLSPAVERITGRPVSFFLEERGRWEQIVDPQDLPRWYDFVARVATGQSEALEYRIRRPDGKLVWVRESVVTEAPGRRVHGILTDISDRKRAEEAALERQRLEAQKLESLTVLAGGIAHDFNNLLTGILGNAGLARMSCAAGSPLVATLEQIEAVAVRGSELCKQMLTYAGKTRFVPQPVALNAAVRDTVEQFGRLQAPRAALRLELAENLPPVLADDAQLRQVVLNLVLNAVEALNERPGTIAVATGTTHFAAAATAAPGAGPRTTPDPFLLPAPDLAAGEYAYLEVRDTGSGIAEEIRGRIFEPFFTTKFTGRGLGLAAVLGIVRSHKGAIHVDTAPGQGSTFRVLLPLAADAPPVVGGPGNPVDGLVLVIDPETAVRAVTCALLQGAGFRTVEAASATDGLARFGERVAEIRLVLLDELAPHLEEPVTQAHWRHIATRVPVIVVTGPADPEAAARVAQVPVAGRLNKPFRPGELMALVRQALLTRA